MSEALKESVKALEGPNVGYDKEAKAIYYSPNRFVPKTKMNKVVQYNGPDVYRAIKQFKADYPGEKVNIVRI
jgi:hypothetical protein